MKKMKELLKKRLEEKKMAGVSLGAFVISILRKHAVEPGSFEGYVKNNIAFITLSPAEDKTKRFMKKQELLQEINDSLRSAGYEGNIKDIRVAK